MNNWYGNIVDNDTIYMTFNTFNSDGASVTATIVDGDIEVYKDGGLTQLATNGATVQKDFDGITGAHQITINTGASGDYAIGSDFSVRVEAITVDSQTVNAFIGTFSIQNRFMRGTDAAATSTKQDTMETTLNDVPNTAEFEARTLVSAAYVVVGDTITGVTTAGTVTDGAKSAKQDTMETTLNDVPTTAEFEARTIVSANYVVVGDTLARVTLVDTVTTNTDKNTLAATDIVTGGAIATTGGSVDSVTLTDTATTVTGGATATNVSDAHTTTDALVTTVDTVVDAIKVVTDNLANSATTIVSGTVAATASSTTVFFSDDITEATADHYNGRVVIFTTSGVGTDQLVNQATSITDYELSGGEGKFTVVALTSAPADNDTFVIV